MKRWLKSLLTTAWILAGAVMILQLVLSILLFNQAGVEAFRYFGWILLVASIGLGWLSVSILRKKVDEKEEELRKRVDEGSKLLDTGVYGVVRHPQYLTSACVNLALILIAQNWVAGIIGVLGVTLNYVAAISADQELIDKFGEDYEKYMKRVPRIDFITGIKRLKRQRSKDSARSTVKG
jgi:protein-S-isoprenylcysteine O-methyltransferase Ste14